MKVKLKIIGKASAGNRRVLERNVAPVLRGDERSDEYVCGECGTVLAREIGRSLAKYKDIVMRCPRCGQYNEF